MRSYSRTILGGQAGSLVVLSYLQFMQGLGSTLVGNLTGLGISAINAPPSTLDELRSFLAQFNLASLLKVVGEVAGEHERGQRYLLGVEVHAHALAYVALVAIEASSDTLTDVPSRAAVAKALITFYGLREPLLDEVETRSDAALEHAIRSGYAQLRGESDLKHILARAWLIYGAAWSRSPKATPFDIAAAIHTTAGVTLEQLMVLGYAYSGRARKGGYVEPYSADALAQLPVAISETEQAQFLERSCATYEEIRVAAASFPVPSRDYEKYRLSPFFVKPLVRADVLPAQAPPDALLAPAPAYLARRVTEGVYHSLSKAYQGERADTLFRAAFGYAFQEYVGMLLEACSPPGTVLAEWEYKSAGKKRHTPDWLLLDGDRLVVIEAKQSVMDLNAKVLGHLDIVAEGLKKTLIKGADQLLTFRADVLQHIEGLERLKNVREIELLIVSYDDIPFANWIIRDLMAREVPNAADVHICSIDDFEEIQRYYWGRSLFDALRAKREGNHQDRAWGLRHWVQERAVLAVSRHPLLTSTFDALIKGWTEPTQPETIT